MKNRRMVRSESVPVMQIGKTLGWLQQSAGRGSDPGMALLVSLLKREATTWLWQAGRRKGLTGQRLRRKPA